LKSEDSGDKLEQALNNKNPVNTIKINLNILNLEFFYVS
jgi:hypothetical protein